MNGVRNSTVNLRLLSELLLNSSPLQNHASSSEEEATNLAEIVRKLTKRDVEELTALAASNHVIMRAFPALQIVLAMEDKVELAESIAFELRRESERIRHAIHSLEHLCAVVQANGCPTIVIKSLDHWPDLGSDLDLYTDVDPETLIAVMKRDFEARAVERSWGDRLANKWNFAIPGLPELVEVHVQRLGQTGEQTSITRSLSRRARCLTLDGCAFQVAAPEDRFVISTLQRMYRHFYIRLCDIVDNAKLVQDKSIDFEYLRELGMSSGLWEGIATYLRIISDYVRLYRGPGLDLPEFVIQDSKFGADQIHFRRGFLRVPILPHGLSLYAAELKTLMFKGEFVSSARLSLLPGLATAAALEQKCTGSDKGIW